MSQRPHATLVVPVRHEEGSVGPLLQRIRDSFDGHDHRVEVVFVDDSDNPHTGEAIRRARRKHTERLLVHHIHRTGAARWGGLSGAVVDGFRAAQGDTILVMDGDGQHPPEIVPEMLEELRTGKDIVVASRYINGGSSDGLDGTYRKWVSRVATALTRILFPRGLRGVTDPMTGFFAFRRSEIDFSRLEQASGFKILLELLTAHPETTRVEVPLQFGERTDGESKADGGNGFAFIKQLLRLRVQQLPTFVNFAIGGGAIAVLGALMLAAFIAVGVEPHVANGIQLAATFVLNFLYNRHVTWRGKKGSLLHWQMITFGLTRGAIQVLSWFVFVRLMAAGAEYHWLGTAWRAQSVNVITLVGAMLLNYLTSKYLVFRTKPSNSNNVTRHRAPSVGLRMAAVALPFGGSVLMTMGFVGLQLWFVGFILVYASFGLVTSALEVNWRLYGRRTPEAREAMKFPPVNLLKTPTRTYSIIVPALREAAVIGETLERLLAQTYPYVQIVVTLVTGDDATIAVAVACKGNLPDSRLKVVTKDYVNGSKPKQLNHALKFCTGDVVGVIDAETLAAKGLVDGIDAVFDSDPTVNVVQGGVQLVNLDLPRPASWKRFENYPWVGYVFVMFFAKLWLAMRSWFCVHNDMEYYFWFSSRMEYQVKQGFVPLGGNTVFVDRLMLMEAGGWPEELTEDCALGVLLTVLHGAKVATAYEAKLASREETPSRVFGKGGLVRQRTRWDQGFLSVLLQGLWTKLPTTSKRSMALYILGMPLIQAINGLMLPTAVLGVLLLTAPPVIVLGMFLPVIPMALTVMIQVVALREFGRDFDQKVKLRHYASLILLNPLYQALLALPAIISIYRHLRGITNWQKTDHDGAHLVTVAIQTAVSRPLVAAASN